MPFAPAGVPILAAAAAALLGPGAPMTIWLLIVGLVVTTVAVKAFGPVLFGGRELPPAFTRVIACMAPALLAALVVASLFSDGQELGVGAETVGVAFGGLLIWRGRLPGAGGGRRRRGHRGAARGALSTTVAGMDAHGSVSACT